MVLLLTTQEQVMYFRGYRIRKLSSTPLWFAVIDPQGEQIAIAPSVDAAKALIQRKQETEG